MNLTSPVQYREVQAMIKKGPSTMILVYSPDCGHCKTFKPIWDNLTRTAGKRTNTVSMESRVYNKTPLSQNTPVNAVPSILFVDPEGRVSEVEDIRNEPKMKAILRSGNIQEVSPNSIPLSSAANLFKVTKPIQSRALTPYPNASFKPVIPGTSVSENPLPPLVAQRGGNPWAAFLSSAVAQAAPTAMLLGAYGMLPKRSSGLGRARRTRKK
jgi:hypothetical protein